MKYIKANKNNLVPKTSDRKKIYFAEKILHVGYFDMDIPTKTTFFSKELYKILGCIKEKETSKANIIAEQIFPSDLLRYSKAIKNIVEKDKDIDKKFKFIKKDTNEKIICLIKASVFYDGKVKKIAGTMQDITDLVEFQKSLKQAKKKAEDISRAKSFFLAKTSHDLRQPVQAIRMFIHSLKKQKLDEKSEKIVDNVDFLSENLSNLLDNLLDISKLDYNGNKYNPEDFDLKDVLNPVAKEFQIISKAKEINFIIDIDDIKIFSDGLLIERMIRNLLTNAFKFTKDIVYLTAKKVEEELIISIKDNGIGIKDNEIKFIFDEFFQSKNINKNMKDGVGLGLPIVQKICELIGGKIQVISKDGVGAEFIIKLKI